MEYELYYWPGIQGRTPRIGGGRRRIRRCRTPPSRNGEDATADGRATAAHPPFSPPFLKNGDVLIAHTANILLYLGRRQGLAPREEAGRLLAHQLQLTIADVVDEAHDVHHPIASSLYYEDQQAEARRRATDFIASRIPKYLAYFERVLERNPQGDRHLVGRRVSYCDLSLFQLIAGLRYAFPLAMARLEPRLSRITVCTAALLPARA